MAIYRSSMGVGLLAGAVTALSLHGAAFSQEKHDHSERKADVEAAAPNASPFLSKFSFERIMKEEFVDATVSRSYADSDCLGRKMPNRWLYNQFVSVEPKTAQSVNSILLTIVKRITKDLHKAMEPAGNGSNVSRHLIPGEGLKLELYIIVYEYEGFGGEVSVQVMPAGENRYHVGVQITEHLRRCAGSGGDPNQRKGEANSTGREDGTGPILGKKRG